MCKNLQQANQPFRTFQGIRRPSRVHQSRLPCMDCGRHCSGAWGGPNFQNICTFVVYDKGSFGLYMYLVCDVHVFEKKSV
jgi:hypothetical protein